MDRARGLENRVVLFSLSNDSKQRQVRRVNGSVIPCVFSAGEVLSQRVELSSILWFMHRWLLSETLLLRRLLPM